MEKSPRGSNKPEELLLTYVRRHNEGVVTGDFGQVAALFHPEAELRFLRIPHGPFKGVEEIRRAFMENPPSDILIVLSVKPSARGAEALFSWNRNPEMAAGLLEVLAVNGLIKELTIH